MDEINVYIDRIILEGVPVTPDRAEQIRSLIEVELESLLLGKQFSGGLSGSEITRLTAKPIRIDSAQGERGLAHGLSQSIVRAIDDIG